MPQLQRNLMAINYHTVLSISTAEVPEKLREGRYYGPEPVMMVTLDCELLLLSAWTRGTKVKGKWEPTPLVPAGFLKTTFLTDSHPALRPEDAARIKELKAD